MDTSSWAVAQMVSGDEIIALSLPRNIRPPEEKTRSLKAGKATDADIPVFYSLHPHPSRPACAKDQTQASAAPLYKPLPTPCRRRERSRLRDSYREIRTQLEHPPPSESLCFGSWSLATLKDGYGSSPDRPLFRPIELEEIDDDESDELLHQPEKKRRLTADQVQFLEKSFEFENKLEPERKLRIAKFLGLKPRQIAIWFQNRRARWKTKQLEKDYEALKCSYHTLKMDHGRLLKEKEELETQVLSLTNKLLLKEKGCMEPFELNRYPNKLRNSNSDLDTGVKKVHGQTMPCKQEDISSANSTMLDSESAHCIDEGRYSMLMELTSPSNAFEHVRCDQSQIGEVDEDKACSFLSPRDTSCGSEFHVTEQDLWLWP
ncbi:nuclear protein [Musa troglodytarum]|uniref:Homeobox-leucine zipper protein n=1 Tax=Musa troglodytarum TaxID=320322 RepID=A0A9E7GW27_9LILI|nr:nuclear protein [Musa troglodytarum]